MSPALRQQPGLMSDLIRRSNVIEPTSDKQAWIRQAITYTGDECIEWPWARTANGYANYSHNGRTRYVHRIVLEATQGAAPAGMYAAHTPGACHNRACVNPRHLRWATPKDNARDKVIDRTHRRGSLVPSAKLTCDDVTAIFNDNRSQQAIANAFNVSRWTVRTIRDGSNWNWLTGAKR